METNSMVTELSQKVSQISDTVSDLSAQMTDMHQQMNKIYTAIVGDKNFGHTGLVQRVEELEKVKKKWENRVNWLYGYVLGAGAILAIVFEIVKDKIK
jgi:hypothetical protein